MSLELKGKIALITGAGSGIGREVAKVFIREGACVALADRNLDAVVAVVEELNCAGGHAIAIEMDVRIEASVAASVAQCVSKFGRLDIACNNAGLGSAEAGCAGVMIDEIEQASWDRLIGTNLTGVWLSMKHELKQMQLQRGGSIVNMASIAGLSGFVGTAAYVASKHGVLGLTRTAAMEYGKCGIRVNAVCPGRVTTPMIRQQITESGAVMAGRSSLGRLAEASEIAELVSWLASDRASYCTGAQFVADGGHLAG